MKLNCVNELNKPNIAVTKYCIKQIYSINIC